MQTYETAVTRILAPSGARHSRLDRQFAVVDSFFRTKPTFFPFFLRVSSLNTPISPRHLNRTCTPTSTLKRLGPLLPVGGTGTARSLSYCGHWLTRPPVSCWERDQSKEPKQQCARGTLLHYYSNENLKYKTCTACAEPIRTTALS